MKFENTFAVEAPIDEVYATLLDVERVAPCVPGAEVLERTGDEAYQVAIKVKVGPISMTYRGSVEIVERDDAAHRAVMRARAREVRGQGTADARVELTLAQDDSTTGGTMVADVQLAGRAAAMGRGVIQDVSAKIVSSFAENLEAMLARREAPAEAAAPAAVPVPDAAEPVSGAAQAGPAGGELASAGAETPGPAGGELASPGAETAPPPSTPPPPKPPAPEPAPAQETALPIGQIVGSVIASRLRDPRIIGAAAVGLLALAVAVGRRRRR